MTDPMKSNITVGETNYGFTDDDLNNMTLAELEMFINNMTESVNVAQGTDINRVNVDNVIENAINSNDENKTRIADLKFEVYSDTTNCINNCTNWKDTRVTAIKDTLNMDNKIVHYDAGYTFDKYISVDYGTDTNSINAKRLASFDDWFTYSLYHNRGGHIYSPGVINNATDNRLWLKTITYKNNYFYNYEFYNKRLSLMYELHNAAVSYINDFINGGSDGKPKVFDIDFFSANGYGRFYTSRAAGPIASGWDDWYSYVVWGGCDGRVTTCQNAVNIYATIVNKFLCTGGSSVWITSGSQGIAGDGWAFTYPSSRFEWTDTGDSIFNLNSRYTYCYETLINDIIWNCYNPMKSRAKQLASKTIGNEAYGSKIITMKNIIDNLHTGAVERAKRLEKLLSNKI